MLVAVLSAVATCVLVLGHYLIQHKNSTKISSTSATSVGRAGERIEIARKKQPERSLTPELELMPTDTESRRQAEKSSNYPHLNSTLRHVPVHSREKEAQNDDKGMKQKGKSSPGKATLGAQAVHTGSVYPRRNLGQMTEPTNRFLDHREQGEAVIQKSKKSGQKRPSLCKKTCKQLVVLIQPELETWKDAFKP